MAEFINVNPAHLTKHNKRLSDVYMEFPGWDIGKTSKGALLGRKFTDEHRKKISRALKGRIFTEEWRAKISTSALGRPSGRKGVRATEQQRIENSARQQGVSVEDWTGFSYNRKENSLAKSPDWRRLRLQIKYRDKFICGQCSTQFQGRDLEVHHIIPRRDRPDLTLEPSNCITLCKPCHRRITWKEYDFVGMFREKVETVE